MERGCMMPYRTGATISTFYEFWIECPWWIALYCIEQMCNTVIIISTTTIRTNRTYNFYSPGLFIIVCNYVSEYRAHHTHAYSVSDKIVCIWKYTDEDDDDGGAQHITIFSNWIGFAWNRTENDSDSYRSSENSNSLNGIKYWAWMCIVCIGMYLDLLLEISNHLLWILE